MKSSKRASQRVWRGLTSLCACVTAIALVGTNIVNGFRTDIDKFLGTDLGQLRDHRRQGWMAGAGVAYGYSWILSRHWNIEAELGLGWIYTRYDRFRCSGCGAKDQSNKVHNYVGPTKAAVNLIYVF